MTATPSRKEIATRLSRAIDATTPIPTLEAIEALLAWQHRTSVASHVIELIHNMTREDLPQCQTS